MKENDCEARCVGPRRELGLLQRYLNENCTRVHRRTDGLGAITLHVRNHSDGKLKQPLEYAAYTQHGARGWWRWCINYVGGERGGGWGS